MERRDALKSTVLLVGGTVIGAQFFLSGCARPKNKMLLVTKDMLPILDEIGETILPESNESPGAKAAKIALFMQTMVNDCYSESETAIFVSGVLEVNKSAKTAYGKDFILLTQSQKTTLISQIDKEAKIQNETQEPHFFKMMKALCIWGYFTSEVGATKALNYNPIPGYYKGCVPYKGEAAWA